MTDTKKKDQNMQRLVSDIVKALVGACYRQHKAACDTWEHGEPVKYWFEDNNPAVICIEYQDGKWYHYAHSGATWW